MSQEWTRTDLWKKRTNESTLNVPLNRGRERITVRYRSICSKETWIDMIGLQEDYQTLSMKKEELGESLGLQRQYRRSSSLVFDVDEQTSAIHPIKQVFMTRRARSLAVLDIGPTMS